MSTDRTEQRQQARLQPASPHMWWSPVGRQDVEGGLLIDISRGGLSFILPDDVTAPEVGNQITVHFRTATPRPMVYSVVRHSTYDGATLLGCCRLLRPGVSTTGRRPPKDLVEVRRMRRSLRTPSVTDLREVQHAA